ncbi:MAG: ABC transporter ATP-binding protein [Proteobacteria bacterium]|nr:MAG: ABC transporter ATP-binding protein [Pseudomonadota bacterium]
MSLTLEQVSKTVDGETHIYPTDLSLETGKLNVLLGSTLSGKTSLMRLMAGLEKPTSGRILWQGEDVTGKPVQQRNVAMVYQQFINYPSLNVYENIASPLKLRGLDKQSIQQRVHQAAELMRLMPFLKRKPLELSGGQQQRCALARALVKDADLVLLDEPLANLDYKLREELREEIPRIFQESGAVFVYATTEPTEALLLGGSTAALWKGQVVQYGPTLQVYRQPNSLTTAQVFSDPPLNLLSVQKTGTQLQLSNGDTFSVHTSLADLADGHYTAAFHPNHLRLDAPATHAIRFTAKVNVVELSGSESFVHLIYKDHQGGATGEETRWVALVPGNHDLPSGHEIDVFVDLNKIYWFKTSGELAAAPQLIAQE